MSGLGTIINTAAVIAGSGIGLTFKKGIDEKIQSILMQSCGVAVIFIGIVGTMKGMIIIEDGMIQTKGAMLLIFSLVLGGILGQLIDIEARLEDFGEGLKAKVGSQGDTLFVDGFVNTSLIICVGINIVFGKQFSVGNMLPALFGPIVFMLLGLN